MILHVQLLNTLHSTCCYLNKLLQRTINSDTNTCIDDNQENWKLRIGKPKSFNWSQTVSSFITPMKSILKWRTVCYCIKPVIDTSNISCIA